MKKRIAILGSTGSIGVQSLNVIDKYPELFDVVLLSAFNNRELLEKQILRFSPKFAFIQKGNTTLLNKTKIYNSLAPLSDLETYKDVDIVINGIVGLAGLAPTIAALQAKATLATANKESIICAGDIINKIAKDNGAKIIPIDSEHSTIFQCIGDDIDNVKKIILTASGGAFRDFNKQKISKLKAKDALIHPTWKMGDKVTIDSATMMNKGMEIIEAKYLFNVDNIEVIGHNESIVHSMVEMKDGSFIAGLSAPNMSLPIQYALTYPKRINIKQPSLDFKTVKSLNFFNIDLERFPCLKIAQEVACCGMEKAVIMNSANEILVNAYLRDIVKFYDIPLIIEKALNHFYRDKVITLDDIYRIDSIVREYTIKQVNQGGLLS